MSTEEQITITLTVRQLDAIVQVAEYGIDEKRYQTGDENPYNDYSREDRRDAAALCRLAEKGLSKIYAASK